MIVKQKLEHKTDNNKFTINIYTSCIEVDSIESDYLFTRKLCESGCVNFGKKYSCPPRSPDFEYLKEDYKFMVINAFIIPYKEVDKTFNIIKAANVICKSKQRRLFDGVATELNKSNLKHKILENGSCRLCKQCALQNNDPCRYPKRMRPSMEATGIRVDKLVKNCFNIDLDWYYKRKSNKDNFPKYQCVVGGILTNDYEKIIDLIKTTINSKKEKQYNLLK